MVLWELTLGTAYFLGLRRTYRLALKIQRRVVSSKHPRVRQFLHRKTHNIFDMALRVHKNIQQRDMELGRNLGNKILRWLDRMKPSAQIVLPKNTNPSIDKAKRPTGSTRLKSHSNTQSPQNRENDRHLFSSLRNYRSKLFPTVSMLMKPSRTTGNTTQYRYHNAAESSLIYGRGGFDSVIRKDILQWMVRR